MNTPTQYIYIIYTYTYVEISKTVEISVIVEISEMVGEILEMVEIADILRYMR